MVYGFRKQNFPIEECPVRLCSPYNQLVFRRGLIVFLLASYLVAFCLPSQKISSAKVVEFLVSFRIGCCPRGPVDSKVPFPPTTVIRRGQPTSYHPSLDSELFHKKIGYLATLCTRSRKCIHGQLPSDRLPTTRKKSWTSIL